MIKYEPINENIINKIKQIQNWKKKITPLDKESESDLKQPQALTDTISSAV